MSPAQRADLTLAGLVLPPEWVPPHELMATAVSFIRPGARAIAASAGARSNTPPAPPGDSNARVQMEVGIEMVRKHRQSMTGFRRGAIQ